MMTRAVGTLTPGTLLYQGRYRIDLLLATTPHRAIYRAWNLARGRAATIIELAPATDQLATRALERAAPLVQLDHPALTGFQVVFVEQETVFIGMAFAGGQLLDRIMDERIAPIQPAAAVRWISQAAEMLEFFAGSLPTWHLGDLSPTALFVTVEDRTQILGFEAPLGLLTPADIAAGLPPGSVAPELRDGQSDARSDVYSLAASLYLLLTRQHWGGGDPTTETALGAVTPALPRALIDAVRRGLARDPAQRWGDAAAFNGALLGVMAAPAEATNGNWWESLPSEPEADTQEMQRVDLTTAAAAAGTLAPALGGTDPAHADPSATLDRVPAHIFTDAADDLDLTTKQRAVTPPHSATTPNNDAGAAGAALAAAAAADALLTPTASFATAPTDAAAPPQAEPAPFAWYDAPMDAPPLSADTAPTMAQEAPPSDASLFTPSAPAVAPALLDSLAAASGELDPHGLEDMQPIDHTAVVPSEPPIASVSPTTASEMAADETGLDLATPPATQDEPASNAPALFMTDAVPPTQVTTPWATQPAATASAPATETPTADAPSETPSSDAHWWGWAAAGAAGIAGAAVAAAALHHQDAPTAATPSAEVPPSDTVIDASDDATTAATEPPSARSAPSAGTYVPSWATTPEDALAPEAASPSPYVPWGYSDALAMTPAAPAEASIDAATPPPHADDAATPAPAPRRYAWQLDDEDPLDAPATADPPTPAVAQAAEATPPDPSAAELESDQLGTWARFADRVSPSTIAQASSAFAGWSAAQPATETDPLPPEPMTVAPASTAAIAPPTHPAPSPFVGQSISAHAEQRYEPNMPPPSAKSKTPSRPLGNNPFFNRIRDLLGATSEPSAALGTIVLPRHMYPQHSYSILVRLQTRAEMVVGGDKRMAIVEVEAPANAFYLPVRRLALPIPAAGGLSEGTLSITALRPSSGTTDRIIFTFKQTDGVVLHKGAYVADVTILTAQQIANGEPMITLVHPLDIPA